MGLASIIENINITFNCFKNSTIEKENRRKFIGNAKKFNIIILPVDKSFNLENLFPPGNNVEEWNIFIIGNDKKYILSEINTLGIEKYNKFDVINTKGLTSLPEELVEFLESVWEETLKGINMQFFIICKSITYLCNSYVLQNEKRITIGAVLFIRKLIDIPFSEVHDVS